jgi:hypothetical protein
MKLALYTVVTGGYDAITPPEYVTPGLSHVCFTDEPARVPAPWIPVLLSRRALSESRVSRHVKMHPHLLDELSGFDATLYVDGSIAVVGDIREFVGPHLNGPGDVFMFDHPHRASTFAEAVAVAEYGHEWIWSVAAQVRRYYRSGFPDAAGLHAGGVILRRNAESWQPLMQRWWQEYVLGCNRDQLALGYSAWVTGAELRSLGAHDPFLENRYFRLRPHRASSRMHRSARAAVNHALAGALGYGTLYGTTAPAEVTSMARRLKLRLQSRGIGRPSAVGARRHR